MTAPFRPRFPWWGGDLQTLRNKFAYRHRALPGEAEDFRIALEDGDTLTGTLHKPPTPTTQPFVVLFHGLTGSENSMYMLEVFGKTLQDTVFGEQLAGCFNGFRRTRSGID